MNVVFDNAHLLRNGLRLTLELSALVILVGSLFGTLVGIGLVYGNRLLRTLLRLYVDLIRGLPTLVVIFLIFYGLPALNVEIFGYHVNTNFGRFETATLAFTLFAAAHIGEIVRGALSSLPSGQTDAAKSIGLTFWKRLWYVLLPQSIPVMIPPWTNTAAELVKATSLVTLVSMSDLLFATQKIAERTGEMVPLYLAAAAIYFSICFSISRLGVWVSNRFRYGVAR